MTGEHGGSGYLQCQRGDAGGPARRSPIVWRMAKSATATVTTINAHSPAVDMDSW